MENEAPLDERALSAITGGEYDDVEAIEEADVEPVDDEPVGDEPVDDDQEPSEDAESDEPDEVEAKDDDDEDASVEIEIDGEIIVVPEKYKDYFLRQQDYTTKTQEVATQRKQVEAQLAEVEQRRQQFEFAQQIQPDILKAQQLEAQANQYHEHLKANIDSLSATDITKIQMAIQETREERDSLVNELQTKHKEFQQSSEQSLEELRNKGTEVLKQKIPGWGETQQKQVREYALTSGFTEAEIAQVLDPRQVEVLYKASQYDALKSGVAPAIRTVQKAVKPKSRNKMDQAAKDRLALNKVKKSNLPAPKKAEAIMDSIANRFS